MLFHLEPSVEMTGGPWYTDNELDTEFIKLLCSASLRFIRDRSTPKHKGGETSSEDQPLYPISAAPSYPTTQQVQTFLSKSRITETQLSAEHVEMLLNVLVLDGEIERVPAFGAAIEREDGRRAREKGKEKDRKRKRKERDDADSPQRNHKRKKRSKSWSISDSELDSSGSDEESERRKKGDRKRKSRSRAANSDEDDGRHSTKRKKKHSRDDSGGEDGERDGNADGKSKSKSKSRKRSKYYSSESESDSDSNSDSNLRSRSQSKSKSKSVRKRSSSPAGEEDVTATLLGQEYGAYVYRAVRQERVAGGGGGLAQAPCVRCSVFDFCREGGPVNPGECEYYGSWLVAADVANG
uniref:Peroxisomal biogenesis factor n=1 Tax=Ganoderma boninense TaxID=34458 RepID=A0A5K1K4F5_9APHY|nr:Peroxisomal biogenesis factor [Ganoderma boninense]